MDAADQWNVLRFLIGIFKEEEIVEGDFNLDVEQVAAEGPPSLADEFVESCPDLNTHYWCSMQGESTKFFDFRKAVKVKNRKPKAKAKWSKPHNTVQKGTEVNSVVSYQTHMPLTINTNGRGFKLRTMFRGYSKLLGSIRAAEFVQCGVAIGRHYGRRSKAISRRRRKVETYTALRG